MRLAIGQGLANRLQTLVSRLMLEKTIRSEAHFAAMLYCELKQPSVISHRFLSLVEALHGKPVGTIQSVFVEPAPFRDAWESMKEEGRKKLARDLLNWANPNAVTSPDKIGSMFNKESEKLRSPANWTPVAPDENSSVVSRLRFMFRARCDMLVITELLAIWIELKVRSPVAAVRKDGYDQIKTQQQIAEAASIAVPDLAGLPYLNVVIQRKESQHPKRLTWKQIIGDEPGWNYVALQT